ncbi:HTH-type transcriptional regulator BenM [Cupriavidus campinensis]|uniref:LysR family transcriptional regulator n=1 Tax=Cupriavidus campinensis TaxID=151783 RepID=A0AAE9L4W2_9BURK|nr:MULTISPECIES: LysR family transcriptional regulator [Cupriavidus]URF07333.1 LysR family transcriptional regulator [Cupriavidus campinensis]CAG2143027.1 HTH-type transcriptional regulator BenM [Cupriavidus campinensis]
MNLRQLRYFCEVVDAGSAAEAANRLFVAPTAISMQLGQLESLLGAPVFDRSRRPMTLTATGQFLYPRAKDLLAQMRRLDEEARAIAAGNLGWLGIGFTRSAIFSILPAAVQRFREQHPDVHLDPLELLSEHQPAQLRRGRIDVGISRYVGEFERPADLHYTTLFEDPFVAAVPLQSPLAQRTAIAARELDALPLIQYPKDPQSGFASHMVTALRDAGAHPTPGHEAIEIHTALGLVAAGLGFTLVGASVAAPNRTDVAFVPIDDLRVRATLVAVTRAGTPSPVIDAFVAALAASHDGVKPR